MGDNLLQELESEIEEQDSENIDSKEDSEVDVLPKSEELIRYEDVKNIDNPSRVLKETQKKKAIRPSLRKIIYVLALLVLFVTSTVFGYFQMKPINKGKENIVQTEWGKISLDMPQSEDMVNVLAIGFDKGGYRTDTMMIINFDPKTSNVNLISIPRDTLIGVKGKRMKLNSAFAIGKFDMTVNAIRKITGIPIHYYIAVDTKGFRNIIDALGGVQFDVPRDMKYHDPYQDLNIDLKKGYQLLDGEKAEQLVRYRKYVTGDLEREDVQKKFIKAIIEQKLTFSNLSDISKVKALYNNLSNDVKTNVSFNDAVKYFVPALKIKPESFKTYTLPGQPRMINGGSYYIYDKNKTQKMISEIFNNVQLENEVQSEYNQIELYDISDIFIKSEPVSEQVSKDLQSGKDVINTETESSEKLNADGENDKKQDDANEKVGENSADTIEKVQDSGDKDSKTQNKNEEPIMPESSSADIKNKTQNVLHTENKSAQ